MTTLEGIETLSALRTPGPLVQSGKRILIVDDDDDVVWSFREILRDLGYVVETACDGPSAIEKARWFLPDVALLDIGLPGLDGFELACQLKTLTTSSALRIVAVTGFAHESYRTRSVTAGFAAHLVKPVTIDRLASAGEAKSQPRWLADAWRAALRN